MEGREIGPYRVVHELGAGGMGRVYLAETVEPVAGLDPGAQVALKVVHPQLLATPGFFKRFLREAELGRRVQHESVVRTLDVDATVVDGVQVNFMVMEYVAGRTLRRLLEDLGTVPDALLREIALQTAAGLEAIHGAGIVHRDLKPENVLVTDDQRIRIMDLGVARLQEASVALTREGSFAGSLLYAAPEQIVGDGSQPSCDLYAVGVLLHELATGTNPFRRDDMKEVIAAHLRYEAPRAADVQSGVTPFMSELIATLLAKDPAARLPSAAALRETLARGEGSAWWSEREAAIRKRDHVVPRVPVRREAALHGRAAELSALREAWAVARTGEGRIVLLEGEAGIGKSRLVDAFLEEAGADDVHLLYGAYPPSGGLGGISEGILARFGAADLEEAIRPRLATTPALVPAFAALLRHEPPPAGATPLAGDSLQAVFVHFMRGLAAEKPLLWALDDLHFAPRESRDVILALCRAVARHRVLLVLTSRQGLSEEETSALGRLDEFRRVPLARLGAREVIELLRDTFKSATLAERLGGKIAYKSDGVPFAVFEMIRGLRDGSFLRREADGTWVQTQVVSEIEVPSGVKDLVEARLRALSEGQRAILDVGAVEGRIFDPGLVAAVLEEKKVRVLRDLAEIERRFGLVHGEPGGCRFDQNQVQEVLFQALPPDLRAEYHGMLADAYAAQRGLSGAPPAEIPGDAAVFLARHRLRSSRPSDGAAVVRAAVAHLVAARRHEEALEFLELALAPSVGVRGDARLALLVERIEIREALGLLDGADAAIAEAETLARAGGDDRALARVCAARCDCASVAHRFREAEEHARQSIAAFERCGAGSDAIHLRIVLAWVIRQQGRWSESLAEAEAAYRLACESGETALEAMACGAVGEYHATVRAYDDQREWLDRELALRRRLGDAAGEARIVSRRAQDCLEQGRYAEAQAGLEDAIARFRALGLRSSLAFAQHTIASLWLRLGRTANARECREAGNVTLSELGTALSDTRGRWFDAHVAATDGDYARAVAAAQEFLGALRSSDAHLDHAWGLSSVAEWEAMRGRSAEAAAAADAAIEANARAASWEPGIVATAVRAAVRRSAVDAAAARRDLEANAARVIGATRLRAQWWLWKADGDRAALAESWRLLSFLRDHAPPEHRESVVANVALHRAIAAASREQGIA